MAFKPITSAFVAFVLPLLFTVPFIISFVRSFFFWRKYEYKDCGFFFAHFMRLKDYYLSFSLSMESKVFTYLAVFTVISVSILGNRNLFHDWKKYDLRYLTDGKYCFAMQVINENSFKEYTLPAEVIVKDDHAYVGRAYWSNGGYFDFENTPISEALDGVYYESHGVEYQCFLLTEPSYSPEIPSFSYQPNTWYDLYTLINLTLVLLFVILTSYYASASYAIRHDIKVASHYEKLYKEIDKDFMSKSNAFCTSAFSIKEFAKQPFILSAMFFEITQRCRYGTSTMPFVVYAACEIGKLRFPDAETEFKEDEVDEIWKFEEKEMGFENIEECRKKSKPCWEYKRQYWNHVYNYGKLLYDDMEEAEYRSRIDEYTNALGQIAPAYKIDFLNNGNILSEIGYEYRNFIKAFEDSGESCCSACAKISGMQMEDMVAKFREKRVRY